MGGLWPSPQNTVLFHICFDNQEGRVCFILMRNKRWIVNDSEWLGRESRAPGEFDGSAQ